MSDSGHNNIAIEAKNISKDFILPHDNVNSIKQVVLQPLKKKTFETQHALKNVSLEIKKGEFFGVVGKNGSGKSTLLKILAGIYNPTEGSVKINGSLVPFIELGVGLNPELTGRDNIYLNGALLGFSRSEMNGLYDEIVKFAELERFMDQKVKNYSSGMQVRLAFSIAIRARSEILLLDEVLAVGDEAFQKKCVNYFYDIKKKRQTIILVTHDMTYVERFCDRVMVLNKGEKMGIFEPGEAKRIYEDLNREKVETQEYKSKKRHKKSSSLCEFDIITLKGDKDNVIEMGQEFSINITTKTGSTKTPENVTIGLAIEDEAGTVISGPNTTNSLIRAGDSVEYSIPRNVLNTGTYNLRAVLFDENVNEEFDHIEKALTFEVVDKLNYKKDVHGKVDMLGEWRVK